MDKKSSDEKKSNKQVSLDVIGTFPFHSSPFRTIMCMRVHVWAVEQCGWGTRGDASTWCWDSPGHPRQQAHLEDHTSTGKLSQGLAHERRPDSSGGRLLPRVKKSLSICLTQFYAFSTFAMQLNELEKSTEGVVPPTDSRLRPDIRALENGDLGSLSAPHFSRIFQIFWAGGCVSTCIPTVIELASAEKKRLEEKQRMARKNRSKSTEEWKTRQVQGPPRAAWPLFMCFNSCIPAVLSYNCNHSSVILHQERCTWPKVWLAPLLCWLCC